MTDKVRLGPAVIEQLDEHIQRGGPDECWPWMGPISGGFPVIRIGRGSDAIKLSAQRASFMRVYGDLPPDHIVIQNCGGSFCCNPKHLVLAKKPTAHRGMAGRRGTSHPRAKYQGDIRLSAIALRQGGWSMVDIAKTIGCHRVTVSRWIEEFETETGWRLIPSETMKRSRPAL